MINTLFLDGEKFSTLVQVTNLIRAGELIAFPTDTVYGVGCDPWNPAALTKLYTAKERELSKGIPILLSHMDDLQKVSAEVTEAAAILIQHFWPGPLTIIVPRHPSLPASISPDNNIAVRLPAHTVARKIIREVGGALATTSANRSGEPPALNGKMAWDALAGKVAAVVDGYHAYHAAASTIVDCTVTPIKIVRPGPISAQELQQALSHTQTAKP